MLNLQAVSYTHLDVYKRQGILMELYSISEEEAYNRIRALSMKKRDSIVNICKALINQVSK